LYISTDNSQDGAGHLFEEEQEEKIIPREGTIVHPRADGRPPEPPEGFTIYTTESGIMTLRRKRQRNLHKLGIIVFSVS
jgi:histone-lysine N-methyltransferase MLL3